MTAGSWTHRLEEWSHPLPANAIATAGLVILAIGIVLLALGGVALSQDPGAFDLWVIAIGLFLLAGAIVGIGRSTGRSDRPDRPRSYSDHASLAEAPAFSAVPADPSAALRRATASSRTWAASDTIAGQYAEAARLRAGRGAARRATYSGEPDPSQSAGYAYPTDPVRRSYPGSGFVPSRAALEVEVEHLRARVAELESTTRPTPGGPVRSDTPHWPGPSQCVGCGTPLVGGPDDGQCARCGRPLCPRCYAAAPAGPDAHQCPECRGAPTASASIPAPPIAAVAPSMVGPGDRAPSVRPLSGWESP